MSRSAVPDPHATHVPCVRRIVGSSAVTSPPAGCLTSMLPRRAAHVLVRLAIGDEDQLAIVQVLRDIDHKEVMKPQQPCPIPASRDRAIGERTCAEYV